MKKSLKIVLTVLTVFVLVVLIGVLYITNGLKEGEKLQISSVDVTKLKDGTYKGTYNSGRWSNELKVTVKDGKITDIKIVKDVKFIQPGMSDKLFDRVIKKQNTDVDVVTGATVTSKAYLKSIENALS